MVSSDLRWYRLVIRGLDVLIAPFHDLLQAMETREYRVCVDTEINQTSDFIDPYFLQSIDHAQTGFWGAEKAACIEVTLKSMGQERLHIVCGKRL